MAIGPVQQDEGVTITAVQQVRLVALRTLGAYFSNPAHYLFYTALTATVIGLFFGLTFSLIYYGFLAGLAFIELCRVVKSANVLPDPALDK